APAPRAVPEPRAASGGRVEPDPRPLVPAGPRPRGPGGRTDVEPGPFRRARGGPGRGRLRLAVPAIHGPDPGREGSDGRDHDRGTSPHVPLAGPSGRGGPGRLVPRRRSDAQPSGRTPPAGFPSGKKGDG